jgi:hypothetical protein
MIKQLRTLLRRVRPMELTFTKIYRTHRFGGELSASGPGSDMAKTEAIRQALPCLLKEFGIKTILDAPCGDFYWMRDTELNVEKYIGADIVGDLVRKNQETYGRTGREFRKLNIVKDQLPQADVLLCRDCLVHFSNKDVLAALRNFKASGITYLLTTTFVDHSLNTDIITGEWRPLNLQRPPFNFPPPMRVISERYMEEQGQYIDKGLALWKMKDIPIDS